MFACFRSFHTALPNHRGHWQSCKQMSWKKNRLIFKHTHTHSLCHQFTDWLIVHCGTMWDNERWRDLIKVKFLSIHHLSISSFISHLSSFSVSCSSSLSNWPLSFSSSSLGCTLRGHQSGSYQVFLFYSSLLWLFNLQQALQFSPFRKCPNQTLYLFNFISNLLRLNFLL